MDKSGLIEQVLDRYNTTYNTNKHSWQDIHCPNQEGHAHGDKNPSCRLNLTLGLVKCMGCDLVGDGYNIVMTIEHVDFLQAKEQLGAVYEPQESTWII